MQGYGSRAPLPKPKDKNRHPEVTVHVVRRGGFEPPASWSVARRSIQLSYRRIFLKNSKIWVAETEGFEPSVELYNPTLD